MGGGRRNFLSKKTVDEEGEKGVRKDGKNLIKVWLDEKRKRGKTGAYLWNREQLMELNTTGTDFVLGLFESSHMQYHLDAVDEGLEDQEPTLSDMVEKSLEVLQNNGKGYFLFVEGGRIDHAHHSTKAQKALDETLEFATAVELAVNMTNQEDTLIVVTSDHAHTMSFSGYPERGNDILGYAQIANDQIPIVTLSYANGPGYAEHTTRKGRKDVRLLDMLDKDARFPAMINMKRETHGGQDVAVFARGPWAHLFSGNYEQHFIPHLMAYAACIGNGTKSCDN